MKMAKAIITEKYLDKKLSEHTKILVTAVDSVLIKRLATTEIKIDGKIEGLRLDISALKTETREPKKELIETKEELKKDINNVQTFIDGCVKARKEFKQEFVIMKEEVKKMKEFIKEKSGYEINGIKPHSRALDSKKECIVAAPPLRSGVFKNHFFVFARTICPPRRTHCPR